MTCCAWSDNTLEVPYGQRIEWMLQLRSRTGDAIQLGGVTISVLDASQSNLLTSPVTIADEERGLIRILIERDVALTLRRGRVRPQRLNWLRLELAWPLFDGVPNRTTPQLWIVVK